MLFLSLLLTFNMGKSPAFQFYPNDWLGSAKVAAMTPAQEGAYIRLLSYMWNDDDNSLPDDDNELASLSRLHEGWLKGGSTVVRKCFIPHPTKEGFLTNKRMLKEVKKQELWRKKSSEGGQKSALKRAETQKKDNSKGGSTTVPTKAQPKLNSSSSSSSIIKKNINIPKSEKTHKLQLWINEHCKYVPKMKNQLTYADCEKIEKTFDPKIVAEALKKMDNSPSTLKNNFVYYTLVKTWIPIVQKSQTGETGELYTKPEK